MGRRGERDQSDSKASTFIPHIYFHTLLIIFYLNPCLPSNPIANVAINCILVSNYWHYNSSLQLLSISNMCYFSEWCWLSGWCWVLLITMSIAFYELKTFLIPIINLQVKLWNTNHLIKKMKENGIRRIVPMRGGFCRMYLHTPNFEPHSTSASLEMPPHFWQVNLD